MSDTNSEKDRSQFRKVLDKLMKERHLSMQDIARLADVNRSVVYYWLEGSVPRDLRPVSKLAKALEVSFHYLLLGEDESKQTSTHTLNDLQKTITLSGHCQIIFTPTQK